MSRSTRRRFLASLGTAVLAAALDREVRGEIKRSSPDIPPGSPFSLGIASYSFRKFPLEKVIEMTSRLGVRNLTLKDMHLPVSASEADIEVILRKLASTGLSLTSAGVVYMATEDEIRRAFAFAKRARLKLLVGVPEQSLLRVAEQSVKESGIALAIHNHGPKDVRFPSPESVYALVAGMDRRMGLCLDIGHTRRLGLDPSAEFARFADRILDVHIKDVSSADAAGTTVEIGRGVIDIPRFLETTLKHRYAGTLHFEFEKDEQDPLPGLAESIGYVRGVLAGMTANETEESR